MTRSSRQWKSTIALLYKPPLGQRQVLAMSRVEAERLPCLPTVAVISITAPERLPAKLDHFEHLLRLSFADVDHLDSNLSARAKAKLASVFTRQQAQQIRSFVQNLPPSIASIVVHCEGGYSRSCAVALGLHRLYGYQVDLDSMSHANSSVLRVLITPMT